MKKKSKKFRAFISYSHADVKVAAWLHRTLESYRLPASLVGKRTSVCKVPVKLGPIFRDRDELAAAGDLSEVLVKALKQSTFLIVIASPAAAKSRWVNEEVKTFKQTHSNHRVLVLIVEGTPGSDDEYECLPLATRRKVNSEGEITDDVIEPLAADLRSEGDGKKLAKLKLVAGLTGLNLDTLVQREQARRYYRLATLATIAVFISISMTIMAVLAVRGQSEAERQRTEAVGLVEFMLTDLRMQLEPVGRLEIFDAVGKRALEYFAKQNINKLDADSLGHRARALHLVGEVHNLRADTQEALKAFIEAEKTTAELLQRYPNDISRVYDHAQSTFWVGYVAWKRSEFENAERLFLEYHRLASQLVDLEPDNENWLLEKSSALVNLGVMMHNQNLNEEAINYFQQALEIDAQLVATNPNDREKQWSKAQSHAWLADAFKMTWQFTKAMEQRQAEFDIYSQILALDNLDARALEGISVGLMDIANLHLIMGNYSQAEKYSRQSLSNINRLIKDDPSNKLWKDFSIAANNQMTEVLMSLGRWDEAQQLNKITLRSADKLVKEDPTVIYWQTHRLMFSRFMEIFIAINKTEPNIALSKITAFKHEFGDDPDLSRESARIPWIMVLAAEIAINKDSEIDQKLEQMYALTPILPRELAIHKYFSSIKNRAYKPVIDPEKTKLIKYDPNRLLN